MLILCLLATLAGELPAKQQVPLARAGHYLVIGDVWVNGHGPYRFLLDTGAQSSVLDLRAARAIGLAPTYRVEVVTVNGNLLVPATPGASLQVGPHTAHNVELLFYDLAAVRQAAGNVAGILGQSFLARFAYRIDLRRLVVDFNPTHPAGGLRLPLLALDGRPAVRLGARSLVLDSAAPALIFYQAGPGHPVTLGSVAGPSPAHTRRLARLSLGPLHLRNVPVVFQPNSHQSVDGLLPLFPFDQITIDLPAGAVTFHGRPTLLQHIHHDIPQPERSLLPEMQ